MLIEQTTHGYFQRLARVIQCEFGGEITSDYSKDGLWVLSYWSFVYGTWNRVKHNPYIVVQTEPLHIKDSKEYQTFLNGADEVWDYTKNLQMGYSDVYRLEAERCKDIDVLFYGIVNERRNKILQKIPNVTIIQGVYEDIWKYVRRSKIVLSIHKYDNSNNDLTRVAPLLCNRAFVIAEKTNDEIYNKMPFTVVDKEDIPANVELFLKNPVRRLEITDISYNFIRNFKTVVI
jgi:hypothetical protein